MTRGSRLCSIEHINSLLNHSLLADMPSATNTDHDGRYIPYSSLASNVYTLGTASITLTTGTLRAEHFLSSDDMAMQGHEFTMGYDNSDEAADDFVMQFLGENIGKIIYRGVVGTSTDEFDFEDADLTTLGLLSAGTAALGVTTILSAAGDQFTIAYDGSNDTVFDVNLAGLLTITPSGGATTFPCAVDIAGNLTVDTDVLYVNSTTHRTGMGIATPLSLLHVDGIATIGDGFTGAAANALNILNILVGSNGNGGTNGISFFESTTPFGMRFGYDGTGAGDANALRFYDNTSAALVTIQNGGNFGINETSPQDKLEVNGNILVKDKLLLVQDSRAEYITSLNAGYNDYVATTAHRFNNDVVLPKTSGKGIKVDTATPTFGWADLLGDQFSRNTGGTKPTLATYNDTIDAWQFSDGDESFHSYHIPHDYVPGTDIHLHVHWSQNNAGATGGTIDFKYFAIYSKGHNQVSGSVFTPTPITATFSSIDINDGDSGLNRYQHHITEVIISAASATGALFDRDDFEPDGVIELTFEMDANNLTGTPSDPFIHFVDIHYQTTGLIGTKQKAPDFYT